MLFDCIYNNILTLAINTKYLKASIFSAGQDRNGRAQKNMPNNYEGSQKTTLHDFLNLIKLSLLLLKDL